MRPSCSSTPTGSLVANIQEPRTIRLDIKTLTLSCTEINGLITFLLKHDEEDGTYCAKAVRRS